MFTVADLITRLQQLPPEAIVVNMASEDGYYEVLGACRLTLVVRRPNPYPRKKGFGEYVDTEGLPKNSKKKRIPAVMIGLLTGDQRPFDEQHNIGSRK
jgi:hypothetical protein